MARSARRPTSQDPREALLQLATDLDLTALATALPELLAKAETEKLSFTDFALTLLRRESAARAERRLARSRKRSALGPVLGPEGFDWAARPDLDPRIVKELVLAQFVREKRNVLCLGKPGTGKTRVCDALADGALLAGHSVLKRLAVEMLEDLHASHADGTWTRALNRYVKPDVLYLDEFGSQAFDETATKYLFRVVSSRYGKGSILLAANTGFKQWHKFFPSEAHAVATLDRLVDRASVLRFTGKSFRAPKQITGASLDE